jgi:hypothetical protein
MALLIYAPSLELDQVSPQPIQPGSIFEELANDPKYQAMRKRKEAEHAERVEAFRKDQEPIGKELEELGLHVRFQHTPFDIREELVTHIGHLTGTSDRYPEAIPILLKHIDKDYPDRVKECVARALATPDAKYARDRIVAKYESVPAAEEKGFKDGLAVAVLALSDDGDFEEIVQLLRDRRHGSSRVLLLTYLQKSKRPEAAAVIEELSLDPDLAIEIKSWRRKK